MAGSYQHVTLKDGSFDREGFYDMIENLGDAYEAIEKMHFMIRWLASSRAELSDRPAEEWIEASYRAFLKANYEHHADLELFDA